MLQAVRPLAHLSAHYQTYLSPAVVCCLVLVSAVLVAASVAIRKSPVSALKMLAAGGTTYPLYLLHANLGFLTLNKLGALVPHAILVTATTVLLTVISWAVWRWLELPARRRRPRTPFAVCAMLSRAALLSRPAAHLWEPADPVALQAAVQRGSGQVRDRGLQGVEAVVQRLQGVSAKGDDHRLLLGREHRRVRRLRPLSCIMHEGALAPLRHHLGVQSVLGGEVFERSFRSL
jgi:hypothetical protein